MKITLSLSLTVALCAPMLSSCASAAPTETVKTPAKTEAATGPTAAQKMGLLDETAYSTFEKGEEIKYPDWAPIKNIKDDYGAKGDGVTDDTAAIQKAIQDRKYTKQLFFPPGVYLISKTLVSLEESGAPSAWLQLYGAGKGRTTIRLQDGAADFQSTEKPAPMIHFRGKITPESGKPIEQPNVAFFNSVYDMTIDAGKNNPGAVGIDWIVCNSGELRHVNIVSGDGQGFAGVRMNSNDGTSFIRDLSVDGFDYGWYRAADAQSLAVEGLRLKNQNKAGIFNLDSVLAVHDLTSDNKVPTLI